MSTTSLSNKLLNTAELFLKLATGTSDTPRGEFIFPSTHPKVKSGDHFPINTIGRGRNALSRVKQYSARPEWYTGTLEELNNAVERAVHSKYKSIESPDE
jgi:hypothetical protein